MTPLNRFGTVAPFAFQPSRRGLRRLGSLGVSYNAPVGAGAGAGAETGAAQGASIGSAFGPIGSLIGGVVGAVGGAIAGSINKKDPEEYNFEQAVALWQVNPNNVYNIGDKYLVLAGLFDLNLPTKPSATWSIPIYIKYGHMGEQRFTQDFANLIYQAAMSGQITASDTPETIMARIVQPWIDSWGYSPMIDPHADLIEKILIGMVADYVSGQQGLWLARGGDAPNWNIPPFPLQKVLAGSAPANATTTTTPVTTTAATTVTPVGSAITAATPIYSPTGTVITPQNPGALTTPMGIFSVAGTTFENGQTTVATYPTTVGLEYYAGQVYRYDANGAVYMWTGNGWQATNSAPAAPASLVPQGLPPTVGISPVGSGVTTTTQTPQQLVASPPAVGTVVAYAPDFSQSGKPLALPANLEYTGSDPYNGSWILQNTATGGMYVLWQGQLQPYSSNLFAPASTATTSTASSVPVVTGSGTTGVNTGSNVSSPLGVDQTGATTTAAAAPATTDNSGLLFAAVLGGAFLLANSKGRKRGRR